jgi:hypothetical protein
VSAAAIRPKLAAIHAGAVSASTSVASAKNPTSNARYGAPLKRRDDLGAANVPRRRGEDRGDRREPPAHLRARVAERGQRSELEEEADAERGRAHMRSGASTPSRSRERAITRFACTDSASRNSSLPPSSAAPITRQSR